MTIPNKIRFTPAVLVAVMLWLQPVAAWADKPLRIVAFGDSLVAGYGLSLKDALPEQLMTALKQKLRANVCTIPLPTNSTCRKKYITNAFKLISKVFARIQPRIQLKIIAKMKIQIRAKKIFKKNKPCGPSR